MYRESAGMRSFAKRFELLLHPGQGFCEQDPRFPCGRAAVFLQFGAQGSDRAATARQCVLRDPSMARQLLPTAPLHGPSCATATASSGCQTCNRRSIQSQDLSVPGSQAELLTAGLKRGGHIRVSRGAGWVQENWYKYDSTI